MSTAAAIIQIDPADADARTTGAALLLDVRNLDEFAAGHAPKAMLLPLPELDARMAELDPAVTIVAVCRVGGRSQAAAELLAAKGYDVVNLAGGMRAWAAAGLAVVTEDGSAGTVI